MKIYQNLNFRFRLSWYFYKDYPDYLYIHFNYLDYSTSKPFKRTTFELPTTDLFWNGVMYHITHVTYLGPRGKCVSYYTYLGGPQHVVSPGSELNLVFYRPGSVHRTTLEIIDLIVKVKLNFLVCLESSSMFLLLPLSRRVEYPIHDVWLTNTWVGLSIQFRIMGYTINLYSGNPTLI